MPVLNAGIHGPILITGHMCTVSSFRSLFFFTFRKPGQRYVSCKEYDGTFH